MWQSEPRLIGQLGGRSGESLAVLGWPAPLFPRTYFLPLDELTHTSLHTHRAQAASDALMHGLALATWSEGPLAELCLSRFPSFWPGLALLGNGASFPVRTGGLPPLCLSPHACTLDSLLYLSISHDLNWNVPPLALNKYSLPPFSSLLTPSRSDSCCLMTMSHRGRRLHLSH
jgi:hypothetical protein